MYINTEQPVKAKDLIEKWLFGGCQSTTKASTTNHQPAQSTIRHDTLQRSFGKEVTEPMMSIKEDDRLGRVVAVYIARALPLSECVELSESLVDSGFENVSLEQDFRKVQILLFVSLAPWLIF
jgi:hypothetical protein